MKITLYTPDGTAETFSDCTVQDGIASLLTFTGTDWNGTRRKKVTTLRFVIDETETQLAATLPTVIEVFNASPLVQEGGTTFGQLQ